MNTLFAPADFSDLPEFGVGHYTNLEAMTGCTCFAARGECAEGVTGAVDVRGGGPATRETDLLRPENMVQKVNAVMISGGSAFGLESANGAMQVLAQSGSGFAVGPVKVPIVPTACLFDLLLAKPVWPTSENGAQAARDALAMQGGDLAMGTVGAGTGATVGKMGLPAWASKSGFGWSGARLGDLVLIACVAVNAAGNVMATDGTWLAGVKDASGKILDPLGASLAAAEHMRVSHAESDATGVPASSEFTGHPTNTTLGVVLTNAPLTKSQATKVAQQTHDGYARAIKPVHTSGDGDAVFVMASGTMTNAQDMQDSLLDLTGIMAADAMADAIRCAVKAAGASELSEFI